MKLNCSLATLFCGLILFAACKKSENNNDNNTNNNNNTPTPTLSAKAQILVDGKWQMSVKTAHVNHMGKDTTVDLYADMDECEKDDFILFMADGKASEDENTNKCAWDSQIETGSWALLENDTRLALIDSNPDTFDVELNNAQFTITYTGLNSSNETITNKETYKNIK